MNGMTGIDEGNKKKNVLFVNLPYTPINSVFPDDNKKYTTVSSIDATIPLGLLYLSSMIKKKKIVENVNLLDLQLNLKEISDYCNLKNFIFKSIDDINIESPDIIAISFMFNTSADYFEEVLIGLKNRWPESITIIGGFVPTNLPFLVLKNPNVDYIIIGEGEISFPLLVEFLICGKNWPIPGVYSKVSLPSEKESLIYSPQIIELDSIPFPDYDLINNNYERYSSRWINEGKFVPILFSRGCPYKCSYCSGSTVHGKKMRIRTKENIIEEVRNLSKKWDLKQLDINDDNPLHNKNWFLELRKQLSHQFPNLNLNFYNGFHVNSLDEEIIDNLVSTGLTSITLAIESGSPYVLKELMHKNVDLIHAKKMVEYCQNIENLTVKCFYILGMPGEKLEHMKQTLEYAKEIKSDWSLFHAATPLPGTEIFDNFSKEQCINVYDIKNLGELHFLERNFNTTEISAIELNRIIYEANFIVNYFENSNIKKRNFSKALSFFKEIVNNRPYNIVAHYIIADIYFQINDFFEYHNSINCMKELIQADIRSKKLYEDFQSYMKDIIKQDLGI